MNLLFLSSATVEMNGVMRVEVSPGMESGVAFTSRLFTSTFASGRVDIQGRKLVSLRIDSPEKKIDVLEVTSEVKMLGKKRDMAVAGMNTRKGCTGPVTSVSLGMEICAEIQYPDSIFKGPYRASIYMDKTDSIQYYIFEYRYDDQDVSWHLTDHSLLISP